MPRRGFRTLRDRALDADDRSVIRSQRSMLESMLGASRKSTAIRHAGVDVGRGSGQRRRSISLSKRSRRERCSKKRAS